MKRGIAFSGALLITAGLTISGCSDQARSSGCIDAKRQYKSIQAEMNREYAAKTITWSSYNDLVNESFSATEALLEECGSEEGLEYGMNNIPNFTRDDVLQLTE